MADEISGRLFVGQISGPVLGGQIVVDSSDGEISLDSFLRTYLGKRVSITVELLEPEDSNAELERSSRDGQLKYPSRR